MKDKMPVTSRIALVFASIIMLVSMFLPWWGLKFWAPQYPEGLDIIVYPMRLAGDIDIINSLNNYIGMAHFSEETFPEFIVFPYLIILATIALLAVAYLNRRIYYFALIAAAAIAGGVGLYRMYYWLHTFGTNLDPTAPITVDPFVPPIIGPNTIANFETFSNFSVGGWLIFVVIILVVAAPFLKEKGKVRKKSRDLK